MKSFSAAVILSLASFQLPLSSWLSAAWSIDRRGAQRSRLFSSTIDKSSESTTQQNSDSVLKGVPEFESWFSKVPEADCDSSIVHEDFGNLRGLACDASLASGQKDWMTIPRSVVLQNDCSQPDWDAKLAQQLWQEVMQGPSSSIAGYVALLTQGTAWRQDGATDATPPSTAPDALRHWSDEEKELVSSNGEGQRLLDLEKQQEGTWREKFKNTNGMKYEQFVWAMEVVHSRAFCGDFGIGAGSTISNAVTIAAPAIAGAAGFAYYVPFHGQNDAVLLGLAAVAAIPVVINLLKQETQAAVLLPLIDSANHLEEADSLIEYSSIKDSFALSGGSKCLVYDGDKQQLYISYGKKKDTELLLNYGFLRDVASTGDAASRRRRLAETFLSNNDK